MSDDEGASKKSGYRLEYASSARAKCKGPKPCNGTVIGKGELRMGTIVDIRGNTSFAWRHWGCVTSKIITNMKKSFEEADELDGFEELNDKDKDRIRTAWTEGHVADEDIPESARKPAKDGDEEDEDEDEDAKPAKKKAAAKPAKKEAAADEPGVFKIDYATSSRSKCKGGCDESIGKDYLRLAHEITFRGNKSFAFQHLGCVPDDMFAKLKKAYPEASAIEGYAELQDADKERFKSAWDEGHIPEDDKGAGEPAVLPKKAPVKRVKKDNGEPAKKRARKQKKEEDDEEDDVEDEEEEKPKAKAKPAPKRAPAKKPTETKTPAKKRVSKKEDVEDEDSTGDFDADEGDAGDEEDDEEEASSKKRKRAAPAKASKPASKKAAAKPSSSRKKKQVESDDE